MSGYKLKRMISISCILTLFITGCSKTSNTQNAAVTGELTLKENQTLIVGQITSISGNEINLAIAKEVTMGGNKGSNFNKDSNSSSSSAGTQSQSTEQGTSEKGQRPNESGMDKGQRPSEDTYGADGQKSNGNSTDSKASSREDFSGKDSSDNSDNSSRKQQSRTRYELTGEEQTMVIPVGTKVTTLLGTVSTFSRIAVDNTVKIVTEIDDNGKEVVVAVYIVA